MSNLQVRSWCKICQKHHLFKFVEEMHQDTFTGDWTYGQNIDLGHDCFEVILLHHWFPTNWVSGGALAEDETLHYKIILALPPKLKKTLIKNVFDLIFKRKE